MKLNNKGFSMVEIIAAVAIIGVLASIAIFGVSRYKNNAVNNDYEALAKSSYNAMEEYIMANPYETKRSLKNLELDGFLSNRLDPALKNVECEGAVVVENEDRENENLENGNYIVYLCCPNYKKKYTFPEHEIEDLSDETYCEVEEEPDTPEPPTPPTPPSY